MQIRSFIVLSFIACALMVGCSNQQPPRSGPKFSGRILLLNGDATKGAALAEVTSSGDGYNLTTLTPGVTEAVASPDQTHVLYSTKEEMSLRDLHSGAVKSLVKSEGVCLAWAPDGEHFSYQQGTDDTRKLYTSDTNGKSQLILEYPHAAKACPQWISADRLVFDRFVGATTEKTQLKPNTTTVVTIGDAPKLKDTPRKWTIESVCAKNNDGFVRSDQGRLLFAKNIDHFETIDPSPASCSECRFIGYPAQSCTPFFIEQPTSTTTELFYLNPTNLQKQKPASITWTFSAGARFVIKSSARLMVAGDVPDKLLLIDTESGDVTPFFPKQALPVLVSPVPVAWIEN